MQTQAATLNVALSDESSLFGGKLIAVYDGAVHYVERREGDVTVHPPSLLHAVSRLAEGARYSLIIFFGPKAGSEQT